MKPWQHLPNASLIDWVLESLKTDPEKWCRAENAVLNATQSMAWTWNASRSEAWNAAMITISAAARTMVLNAVYDAARDTIWDVFLVLVAYDDCDQYLQMSYDQLLTYATLSERPQAVLLLPLKWVQEHETLVTFT